MSEKVPLMVDAEDDSLRRNAGQSSRFPTVLAFLVSLAAIFLLATKCAGLQSQHVRPSSYERTTWSSSSSLEIITRLVEEFSPTSTTPSATLDTTATLSEDTESPLKKTINVLMQPTETITSAITIAQPEEATLATPPAASSETAPSIATSLPDTTLPIVPSTTLTEPIPKSQHYITVLFPVRCSGGSISSKLYQLVSLYGIARSLRRVPFVSSTNNCLLKQMKEMASYFPRMVSLIETKLVKKDSTKLIGFAEKCCTYDAVEKLMAYNSSRFITISGSYLQSHKFFHKYRADILKMLTFTDEDVAVADKMARETFKSDINHKICVHIRRRDFPKSTLHQESTESFTLASILYVREKLMREGVNTSVALLGDDRSWARTLFANLPSAYVPKLAKRVTVNYAFVARHCQTVVLTASGSTFGFWSAYLSSAENVYYNEKFATSGTQLSGEFNPEDVFLPTWIPLSLNRDTGIISEVER